MAAFLSHSHAFSVTIATRSQSHRHAGRYYLAGRIARETRRVRVIVRLADAVDNRQLWGDSYDGTALALLDLSDRILDGVLHAVQPNVVADQIDHAQRKHPDGLTAREISLRTLGVVLAGYQVGSQIEPLRRAMQLDPDYALPAALAGWCHALMVSPWNSDSAKERALAHSLSARAGFAAANDPLILALRAGIAHQAGDYDDAEALSVKALARDPRIAFSWIRRGWLHEAANRGDEAILLFEQAARIADPLIDGAATSLGIATAHFSAGRFGQSEEWLRRAALARPDGPKLHAQLAVCCLRLGNHAAAHKALAVTRQGLPDITVTQFMDSYPCHISSFRDMMGNGLCELGMPA